jgi:hypothetical protein
MSNLVVGWVVELHRVLDGSDSVAGGAFAGCLDGGQDGVDELVAPVVLGDGAGEVGAGEGDELLEVLVVVAGAVLVDAVEGDADVVDGLVLVAGAVEVLALVGVAVEGDGELDVPFGPSMK